MSETFEHPATKQACQKISEIERAEKHLSGLKQIYQAIIDFNQSEQHLSEVMDKCTADKDSWEIIHQLLLSVFYSIHQIEYQFSIDALHCWIEEQFGNRTYQEQGDQEKSLREMPYHEYLQTDHWKFTREFKLRRTRSRCQVCNAQGIQLNVHHRTYERRGHENDADLIVLCQECHEIFHTHGKLAQAK